MTTASVRFAAIAASRAFPPEASTWAPAAEARWWGEATHPAGKRLASA